MASFVVCPVRSTRLLLLVESSWVRLGKARCAKTREGTLKVSSESPVWSSSPFLPSPFPVALLLSYVPQRVVTVQLGQSRFINMLLSRTSFVSLAAIIASLTLVPMASGEIIYKATGVDYVKRFQPSSGACYYVCPTFVTSGTQADGTPTTTYDSSNNPNGQDDGTLTTCTYSNPTASDGFPCARLCPLNWLSQTPDSISEHAFQQRVQHSMHLRQRVRRLRRPDGRHDRHMCEQGRVQQPGLHGGRQEAHPLQGRATGQGPTVQPQKGPRRQVAVAVRPQGLCSMKVGGSTRLTATSCSYFSSLGLLPAVFCASFILPSLLQYNVMTDSCCRPRISPFSLPSTSPNHPQQGTNALTHPWASSYSNSFVSSLATPILASFAL